MAYCEKREEERCRTVIWNGQRDQLQTRMRWGLVTVRTGTMMRKDEENVCMHAIGARSKKQ